jgi:hypothetical protein
MNVLFSALLGAVGILLVVFVWSDRWRFPLLADFGMAAIALGMFCGAAAISSGAECSSQALHGIWSLIGIGVLLVMLSWRLKVREQRERAHRRSDPKTVDYTALRNVRGGGGQ